MKGADVNQANSNNGATPLFMACQNGHVAIVDALLVNGADVNQASHDGTTPLYIACQNGHVAIVDALLVKGADVNQRAIMALRHCV